MIKNSYNIADNFTYGVPCMKASTLFKILRKRIENRDNMLLLSKTRIGSISQMLYGNYYLHDLRTNKVIRDRIDLLELAQEMSICCEFVESRSQYV